MADRNTNESERGASLIEFSFVAPFLIFLLLGIIEFGFLFTEFNEVKHATREGARYAAASNPDRNGDGTVNHADVVDAVCSAINLPNSVITIVTADVAGNSGAKGELATISVTSSISSLSGLSMMEVFLPDELSSTVEFRLEQPRAWAPATGGCS
jgi:Flp pilus assembly protein TadG